MEVLNRLKLLVFVHAIFSIKIEDVNSDEVCGHANGMVMTGKIVGGYDVGYYKYPWFVSLYRDNIPNCGATLISKKAVLTAAHCFDPYMSSKLTVLEEVYELRMGAYNICDTSERTQRTYHVQKVYVHEKYKDEDPFFDIAMLIMKEKADFEPCCLPSKALEMTQRPLEGYIAGFGILKYQAEKTSCNMNEARVKIFPDKVCKEMLAKVDPEVTNFNHAFCAGYLEGGTDACQGDSGGPLMVLTSGSRLALLGITSFGYKCAEKNLLGIYTDVSHYLDWIHEKANAPVTPSTSRPPNGAGTPSTPSGEDTSGVPTTSTPPNGHYDTTDENDSASDDENDSDSDDENDSDSDDDSADDDVYGDDYDDKKRKRLPPQSKASHRRHSSRNTTEELKKSSHESKRKNHQARHIGHSEIATKRNSPKTKHATRTKVFYELMKFRGIDIEQARKQHHKVVSGEHGKVTLPNISNTKRHKEDGKDTHVRKRKHCKKEQQE